MTITSWGQSVRGTPMRNGTASRIRSAALLGLLLGPGLFHSCTAKFRFKNTTGPTGRKRISISGEPWLWRKVYLTCQATDVNVKHQKSSNTIRQQQCPSMAQISGQSLLQHVAAVCHAFSTSVYAIPCLFCVSMIRFRAAEWCWMGHESQGDLAELMSACKMNRVYSDIVDINLGYSWLFLIFLVSDFILGYTCLTHLNNSKTFDAFHLYNSACSCMLGVGRCTMSRLVPCQEEASWPSAQSRRSGDSKNWFVSWSRSVVTCEVSWSRQANSNEFTSIKFLHITLHIHSIFLIDIHWREPGSNFVATWPQGYAPTSNDCPTKRVSHSTPGHGDRIHTVHEEAVESPWGSPTFCTTVGKCNTSIYEPCQSLTAIWQHTFLRRVLQAGLCVGNDLKQAQIQAQPLLQPTQTSNTGLWF